MEEVLNKTEFSDSIELDFGGVRKAGKVYFNAGKLEESKERITNMIALASYAEAELRGFKEKWGVKP